VLAFFDTLWGMNRGKANHKKRTRKRQFPLNLLVIVAIWYIACLISFRAQWTDDRFGGYNGDFSIIYGMVCFQVVPGIGPREDHEKELEFHMQSNPFQPSLLYRPVFLFEQISFESYKSYWLIFPLWLIALFCATCIGLEIRFRKKQSE
tara:strand:+ start:55 stop:501 length:447 start_codon:yes stop_codon:yes gene_type:complete